MSELITSRADGTDFRWGLLATASAMVLTAYFASATRAQAEDTEHPTVWIDIGGQLERQTGQGDVVMPAFIANNPNSPAITPVSPLHFERPPLFSQGLEAKVTFEPDESGWQFSGAIRYGRSGGQRNTIPGKEVIHHGHYTAPPLIYYSYELSRYVTILPPKEGYITQRGREFAPTQTDQKQSHAIVDFMAGKDVGLGLFGKDSSTTIAAGLRFAQFSSKTSATIHAIPNVVFSYITRSFLHNRFPAYAFKFPVSSFHSYAAEVHAQRNFAGLGPSISWNASTPLLGSPDEEALTVDWGINAAVLFGRQRASGDHKTSGHAVGVYGTKSHYYSKAGSFDRSRRVAIPNLGAMLGMSVKFPNAKVSFGYRGDFFFGAMDTGNDDRKTKTVGFYGPFATVSIGLGG